MVDRGGDLVVVRTRESRVHGEGGQGTDRVVKTEEPSMDLDDQTDEALCGLWNVGEQFLLAATAQNLKRLVRFMTNQKHRLLAAALVNPHSGTLWHIQCERV